MLFIEVLQLEQRRGMDCVTVVGCVRRIGRLALIGAKISGSGESLYSQSIDRVNLVGIKEFAIKGVPCY